jgi:hypothetical protein
MTIFLEYPFNKTDCKQLRKSVRRRDIVTDLWFIIQPSYKEMDDGASPGLNTAFSAITIDTSFFWADS